MPRAKKNEYYILQPLEAPVVKMTKFVDDEPKADSVYRVTRSNCQCFQSQKGQCRHMIMYANWQQRGQGRMKVVYELGVYEKLEDEPSGDILL